MAFLLILGTQTISNNIGVDANRDFSILGHSEVKGQVSAFMGKNDI